MVLSGGSLFLAGLNKDKGGVFFGVYKFPAVHLFCSTLSFGLLLELRLFQLGTGRMSGLRLKMDDLLP